MNSFQIGSETHLLPSTKDSNGKTGDSNLEGVVSTVKLLMKLIQDHKTACGISQNDSRRMLRVAGMMTVLETIKSRIQKSQSFGSYNKSQAELRRCHTELHRSKKPTEPLDEEQKLRRDIKSLEAMCSSLGREKEIMACELARKVHELSEMEELVNDLKTQNETLSAKVKEFALENKEKKQNGDVAALHERNRVLSEQLLRSLDGYKTMKRKLKEANEKSNEMRETMEEMGVEVGASLERIRGFKQRMTHPMVEIEEEVDELEHMFQCFQIKVSKHGQKKGECVKPRHEINAHNSSLLA